MKGLCSVLHKTTEHKASVRLRQAGERERGGVNGVKAIYRVIVGCPAMLLALPLKFRGGDVVWFGSPLAYSFGISGNGQFKIDGFGAAAI